MFAGEAVPAEQRAQQNDKHDDILADQRDAKDLLVLMPPRQPDVQLAAADEAAGQARENQPISARTNVKGADKNDRRAGHVDEQSGKRERPADRIGIKLRMLDDFQKLVENGARPQRYVGIGL